MYQTAPVAEQLDVLCQLLQATFATTNPFERLVAVYNAEMLFYTSYQLFTHRSPPPAPSHVVEEYEKASFVLQEVVQSLMRVLEQVTADRTVTASAQEESDSLLAFCSFLLYGIRGWYANLFSPHIPQIVGISAPV